MQRDGGPPPPGSAYEVTRLLGTPATRLLGTPATHASSCSRHPRLGPHSKALAASGCVGGRSTQVREDPVPRQPGAAGPCSPDSRRCREQRTACRTESESPRRPPGRAQTSNAQRVWPGRGLAGLALVTSRRAGRVGAHSPPRPLNPSSKRPSGHLHFLPISTSTVLFKLTAPCHGLFWGSLLPAQHPPSLWNPLRVLTQTSSLGNLPSLSFCDSSLSISLPRWGVGRACQQGHRAQEVPHLHPSGVGPPHLGSPEQSPHHIRPSPNPGPPAQRPPPQVTYNLL